MNTVLRILVLAAVVCIATGCGVKTAYNNADWLVMRWVNDRVSLTAEQERTVRDALEEHLQWHCANEVSAYSGFLRGVDRDVAAGRITATTLTEYNEQISEFGRRILIRVRPSLLDLLASLNDEQVDELLASFEERNGELREEAAMPQAERRRERVDAMSKGMRRFSGRPTEAQRERIEAWAASLAPTAELALEEELAWQARFREALSLRHDRAAFEQSMSRLMDPESGGSDRYRALRAGNREKTQQVIVDLHRMAGQRQVERFRDRLADWSTDLEELSCG